MELQQLSAEVTPTGNLLILTRAGWTDLVSAYVERNFQWNYRLRLYEVTLLAICHVLNQKGFEYGYNEITGGFLRKGNDRWYIGQSEVESLEELGDVTLAPVKPWDNGYEVVSSVRNSAHSALKWNLLVDGDLHITSLPDWENVLNSHLYQGESATYSVRCALNEVLSEAGFVIYGDRLYLPRISKEWRLTKSHLETFLAAGVVVLPDAAVVSPSEVTRQWTEGLLSRGEVMSKIYENVEAALAEAPGDVAGDVLDYVVNMLTAKRNGHELFKIEPNSKYWLWRKKV